MRLGNILWQLIPLQTMSLNRHEVAFLSIQANIEFQTDRNIVPNSLNFIQSSRGVLFLADNSS
jgi:hypothetical protein